MIHGVKRLFEEITQREVRTQIPIKEGITNENYLINDAFVLRLPRKDHDELINYYDSETIWFGYLESADGDSYYRYADSDKDVVLDILRD